MRHDAQRDPGTLARQRRARLVGGGQQRCRMAGRCVAELQRRRIDDADERRDDPGVVAAQQHAVRAPQRIGRPRAVDERAANRLPHRVHRDDGGQPVPVRLADRHGQRAVIEKERVVEIAAAGAGQRRRRRSDQDSRKPSTIGGFDRQERALQHRRSPGRCSARRFRCGRGDARIAAPITTTTATISTNQRGTAAASMCRYLRHVKRPPPPALFI